MQCHWCRRDSLIGQYFTFCQSVYTKLVSQQYPYVHTGQFNIMKGIDFIHSSLKCIERDQGISDVKISLIFATAEIKLSFHRNAEKWKGINWMPYAYKVTSDLFSQYCLG